MWDIATGKQGCRITKGIEDLFSKRGQIQITFTAG